MNETTEKKSSIKSIKSTILCDYQSYRWFTFLILQPKAKDSLSSCGQSNKLYRTLSIILLLQRTLYATSFLFLLSVIFSKSYLDILYGISIASFSYAIYLSKKKTVSQISIYLLKNDFNEENLSKKTLYQIAEHYSKSYNMPSLVDAMYFTDNISRKAIKFIIAFIVFIYSMNTLSTLISIIVLFLAVIFLINTDPIYKRCNID